MRMGRKLIELKADQNSRQQSPIWTAPQEAASAWRDRHPWTSLAREACSGTGPALYEQAAMYSSLPPRLNRRAQYYRRGLRQLQRPMALDQTAARRDDSDIAWKFPGNWMWRSLRHPTFLELANALSQFNIKKKVKKKPGSKMHDPGEVVLIKIILISRKHLLAPVLDYFAGIMPSIQEKSCLIQLPAGGLPGLPIGGVPGKAPKLGFSVGGLVAVFIIA